MLIENPRDSTRRNGTGLSRSTVNRIIRKDLNWFAYRIEDVQELLETDYPRRVIYLHDSFLEKKNTSWGTLLSGMKLPSL